MIIISCRASGRCRIGSLDRARSSSDFVGIDRSALRRKTFRLSACEFSFVQMSVASVVVAPQWIPVTINPATLLRRRLLLHNHIIDAAHLSRICERFEHVALLQILSLFAGIFEKTSEWPSILLPFSAPRKISAWVAGLLTHPFVTAACV